MQWSSRTTLIDLQGSNKLSTTKRWSGSTSNRGQLRKWGEIWARETQGFSRGRTSTRMIQASNNIKDHMAKDHEKINQNI